LLGQFLFLSIPAIALLDLPLHDFSLFAGHLYLFKHFLFLVFEPFDAGLHEVRFVLGGHVLALRIQEGALVAQLGHFECRDVRGLVVDTACIRLFRKEGAGETGRCFLEIVH
jgi:hypothetical protein